MIKSIDHLVLTVENIERSCAFYERLGMNTEIFGAGRVALKFGTQKINLHEAGEEFKPNAKNAAMGSSDLCFLTDVNIDKIVDLFDIELGPVVRTGAVNSLRSVYLRDPDGNLIEISNEQVGKEQACS